MTDTTTPAAFAPINIWEMCNQAPDLFAVSAQFLFVERYLAKALA